MATATDTTLGGLVAVSTDSKIKPLGYLTWFSVPDDPVSLRKLRTTLAAHGLPPSLAPKDTKAIHTFKRTMREQEGRHPSNGHIIETTVAQVVETLDDCVYQISQVTRDLEERVVDYPRAMRVIFNKHTEEMHFNNLGGVTRAVGMEMRESIQNYYDTNATKVSGPRVRGIVRNFIRSEPDEQRSVEGLSGENLRGKAGGIYFVPAKHVELLSALSEALDELYPGRAYLHAVPMADGASERELIRRHHVANTRQEMKEAITAVRGLLAGGRDRAPRSNVVAHHWSQFRAMERRAAHYRDLLKDDAEEIEEMGGILRSQLDKLIG